MKNNDEATTIKDIVNDIKVYVETSSTLFLYRTNESATEAKYYMQTFDNNFNNLKNNEIIFTTFDILKPSDNCIPYLHNSKRIIKKHEIDNIITDYSDEAKIYIIELMNNMKKHTKAEY